MFQEVLKQLQGSMEEESSEGAGSQELIERLKGEQFLSKIHSRSSREGDASACCAASPFSHPSREGHDGALDELEKERSLLLAELEKEEKEKDWYYAQLQNLTKRIDSLPLTENVRFKTLKTLCFEARQIRSAMEEQLGSCQEMERRAQVRRGEGGEGPGEERGGGEGPGEERGGRGGPGEERGGPR
uniref:Uncharacterized protein n=1 Tax=Neogobius melanostomus TaxID=47308 RepID=A0A8C6WH93_9GOBI